MHPSPDTSTRTFAEQAQLPRVPLPTLEESCTRFLEWCAPLLTADELARTEAAVADFRRPGGPGPLLHAQLECYDATDGVHSWLDTFWPDRYLGRRDRIALNANFFFLFEQSPLGQVDRAAALAAAVVDHKLRIDEETLPPAYARGRPLSMEQNRYLFSSTRIPAAVRDTSRTPYSAAHPGPSRERHVLVFFRGHMFRLDVIAPGGRPHTRDEIAAGLRAVMAAAPAPAAPGTSIGHLTTKARAEWAASRQALLDRDPDNAAAIETIEAALFCICLEDTVPSGPLAASDQLLHGDSANRWFDKAVSLIVFADGTAGFNGEHCNLDGTTVISMLDTVLTSTGELAPTGGATVALPHVEPVRFVLDDTLRADVIAAAEDFARYAAATATVTVSVPDFGSDRAKELGVSPDAFAQLAFQLAHQRAKGFVGATYESIATRHFRHGRTEAMRVVTPEVVRFVAAMDDPAGSAAARAAALRAAAEAHVRRARDCQQGRAPEQHLWELQLIAARRGAELGVTEPMALYTSPGWLVMREDYLSTSAVPSPHVRFWGFGSTSERCIGVGYALMPDRFDLYLSTPRSVSGQLRDFAARLVEAVAQMQDLLSTTVVGATVRDESGSPA